jgi:glycosyltransferase involved in cell wall biosynthesis
MDRPSTRYRLVQYVPHLKENGIETDIRVLPSGLKRWKLFSTSGLYDAVFVQKKLFSRIQIWYLRRKAKKIIYDFDDAIMYTKSKYSFNTRRYKRFRYMIKIADCVIAGNKYLAGMSDTEKTKIIPTVLDVAHYPLHKRRGTDIVVGWIGTKSTQEYLSFLEMLFDKIEKKFPRVTIKIVSDEKPKFSIESVEWEKWNEAREIEQLLSFDIGIMPLSDNPWTRGKCGFKIIQYMAGGIPVICSPVGANVDIVKDKMNGLYASGVSDWERAISDLIMDIELYKKMAVAGRENAEKNYNLSILGPYFAKLIKDSIG